MAKSKTSAEPQKIKKVSGHAFPAIAFILIGLVLLFNNFDLLPWSAWSFLWRFWPLFVILAGLQLLFGRSWLTNSLIFALGFGILAALILFSISSNNSKIAGIININLPWLSTIQSKLPFSYGKIKEETLIVRETAFGNYDSLNFNFNLGAGRFRLKDIGTPYILEVRAKYFENFGKPILDTSQEVSSININLQSEQGLGLMGGSEETNYKIMFGEYLTNSNITTSLGAGSLTSEFENIQIENLNIKIGAGKAFINIKEKSYPKGKVNIDVGTGKVDLILPYGSFIKINYDIGIGILNVDGTSFNRSGSYTTPNFSITTAPKVIEVKIGAGSVNIDTRGN
jgi:hypothetical protein